MGVGMLEGHMTSEEKIQTLVEENSKLKAALIEDYRLYKAEIEALTAHVKRLNAESVERRLHTERLLEKLGRGLEEAE
jgi:argininosuccinate lyase